MFYEFFSTSKSNNNCIARNKICFLYFFFYFLKYDVNLFICELLLMDWNIFCILKNCRTSKLLSETVCCSFIKNKKITSLPKNKKVSLQNVWPTRVGGKFFLFWFFFCGLWLYDFLVYITKKGISIIGRNTDKSVFLITLLVWPIMCLCALVISKYNFFPESDRSDSGTPRRRFRSCSGLF